MRHTIIAAVASKRDRAVSAVSAPESTVTLSASSVTAGSPITVTITVTGAAPGDVAHVGFNVGLQGTHLWAEVTATDTVTIYHRNDTGVPVDLASGTLRAVVWKYA